MGIDIAAERAKKAKEQEKAEREAAYQQRRSESAKAELAKNKWICSVCGAPGKPKSYAKGSFIIEMIFWFMGVVLFFVGFMFPLFLFWPIAVPLVYSIWRIVSKVPGCRSCRGAMVKTDTPVGRELLQKAIAST